RHRTLRAVVDWSWELLDADERALLRRMAVFSGGATQDAVEAVCGSGPDLVAALVDKSLVAVEADQPGVRSGLLQTVRDFAIGRLAEAGEPAPLLAAHTAYFLRFAERIEPLLRTGEQRYWLARLDADEDNLNAVLARA